MIWIDQNPFVTDLVTGDLSDLTFNGISFPFFIKKIQFFQDSSQFIVLSTHINATGPRTTVYSKLALIVCTSSNSSFPEHVKSMDSKFNLTLDAIQIKNIGP